MAPLITREEARELEDRAAEAAPARRSYLRAVPPRPDGAPNRWPSAA